VSESSQSSLDSYTLLIVLFATVVAGATVGLTYWGRGSLPLALLAGGAAGGATMRWASSVFKRPLSSGTVGKQGGDPPA
jgi:hypothetical protein